MEIKINVSAPEMVEAINNLAAALTIGKEATSTKTSRGKSNQPTQAAAPTTVTPPDPTPNPAPAPQPVQQQPQAAPVQYPQTPPQVPVQQAPVNTSQPPVTPPAPTVAPTYTLEQLSLAATQLVDGGKINEVRALVESYGVPALTALPKEKYPEFAFRLREMGAKL